MSDDRELRYHARMREARESELRELRGSRTWRWLQRLRRWKHALRGLIPSYEKGVPRIAGNVKTRDAEPAVPRSVLCLPLIEWDFRFQRPQQLMTQFAKHGYPVFYASAKATRRSEIAPGVIEVPFADLPRSEIVIVQHPKFGALARQLGGMVVYDCMDLIYAFSTERRSDDERRLLADADLVVVTSEALERAARAHAKRVAVIRNGCDFEHFAQTPAAGGPRKVIGYYGAISDWFDTALVAALARKRPDWDFLLVGATWGADLLPLAELPNVFLPGEKPYAELPEWLGVMDVCIIPFLRTPLTEATNPVKVYEMLAAGRPVVSVPLPEVVRLGSLVRLASTADEFEREIDLSLEDRLQGDRVAFARGQTWEARYLEFQTAIGAAGTRSTEARARKPE